MPYIDHLPHSWTQTRRLLADGVWSRWQCAHPVLGDIDALAALPAQLCKDPARCDEIVAALLAVRRSQMAGTSSAGVDGELLLSVAGHLLPGVMGDVCSRLRGRKTDIDQAVVTGLWLALSEGAMAAWGSPRSSLGWRVWVIAVEDLSGHSRAERSRSLVGFEECTELPPADLAGTAATVDSTAGTAVADSSAELFELLAMARTDPAIDAAHIDLLLELVLTAIEGSTTATESSPWHWNHEVTVVAHRRGITGRSVRRHRTAATQALRRAALSWERGELVTATRTQACA